MGSTFTLYADFNLIDGGSTLTKNVTISTNTQVIGDGGVIFDNATVALVDGVLQVELPDNTNDPFDFGYTVRRATGLTKTWRVPVQEPGVRVLLTTFTSTTALPLPPSGNAVSQTDFTAYEVAAAAALAAALAAEAARATTAEAAAVTTAASDATAKVAAETSRATTAEATKVNASTYTSGQAAQDTALATEASTARAAESANATAITGEATTARAAELALRNLSDSTFAAALSASFAQRRLVDLTAKVDPVTADEPGAIVCFGADDGYTRQAGDIATLNALGVPVTMWTTRHWVDGTNTGVNGSWGDTYMTQAQVQTIAAHAVGNEIGYHGVDHENHITKLTALGATGLDALVAQGIAYLQSTYTDHGGTPVVVTSGAYPGGQSNQRVREIMGRRLKYVRGTFGVVAGNPPHPLSVPGIDILALTEAEVKAFVDTAVANRAMVNFLWHSTGDDTVSANFRTKLTNVVAYIRSLGVPIATFGDAMNRRTAIRGTGGMRDTSGNEFSSAVRTFLVELLGDDTVARLASIGVDETNGWVFFDSDGTPFRFLKRTTFTDILTAAAGSAGLLVQPATAQAVGTETWRMMRSAADASGAGGKVMAGRNGGGLLVTDSVSSPSVVAGQIYLESVAGKPRFRGQATAVTGSAPQDVAASILSLLVSLGIASDSTTAWTPAADALATMAVLRERGGQMNALSASATGRVLLTGSTPPVTPAAAGGAAGIFYFDPADYAVAGHTTKMRVRLTVLTNDVAPGGDLTVMMKPVSASAGAAAVTGVTLGTAVATATVTAPAANSQSHAETALLDVPAAGYYALVIANATIMTASSAAAVTATLSILNV